MTRILIIIVAVVLLSCTDNDGLLVGLQPFDGFDKKLTDSIAVSIERTYGIRTIKLDRVEIPKEAFINVKSPRYRADKIIDYLKDNKPDTIDYIIGLTNHDISTTKRDYLGRVKKPESKYNDWGIFGLGYSPGPSCVVSTFRIGSPDRAQFVDRIQKISIHELGHNLGLDHCETDRCVMQDAAETIKTIDNVTASLCAECKKRLM